MTAALARSMYAPPAEPPLRFLTARAPRYTSYPTAPHFRADFPEETYRGWLAALPGETAVSLYLHVPFCKQMCWYCGCNMKLAARYEPVSNYVSHLITEIGRLAKAIGRRARVTHIHWGGGSPTILSPADFARVDHVLRTRFDIAPDAAIAVEIDPRTLTRETARAIAAMGCNRASLGVQEFDAKVQIAVNRYQPLETVTRAVDWLAREGVAALNFDLIYGLPFQTRAALAQTVRDAVSLKPSRLALFGYAHVPWMAANQRMIDEAMLPDAATRHAMASEVGDLLETLGYQRIGIDHFARPDDSLAVAGREGRLRRNFQGYTDDSADALIGLGASSISALPRGYAQNITETGAHKRALDEGKLPVARGLTLSADDRLRRDVIERLMCDLAADLDAIAARHGARGDAFDADLARLDPLIAEGYVTRAGRRVTITPPGRHFARLVAAAFDAYFQASVLSGTARHAKV